MLTPASMTSGYEAVQREVVKRKAPRVLHLVSSGGLYGAEQVILNLARTENVISYVGALHNTHNPNLEVIDEAKKRGLRTAVFDSVGRVDVRTIFRIRRFLRNNDIDILHTHNYKVDIIGFAAALGSRTEWLATNHVWHPINAKLRLYETADAFVLPFAKRIVAVSKEIREDLISTKVRPERIRVIGNGIDLDHFAQVRPIEPLKAALGIRDGDVVVTIVGRLSPEKGHRTFLEVARKMSANRDNVKFLVVGDGPLRDELHAEAARLDLGERLVFAGFREDMPAIYALTDVLVSASSIEGLPMTILEAMASRVPIVATRVGGVPEVIKNGETGLLVESPDVEALKAQIESLVDDPSKRRRLSEAALEFVKTNHSYERMCEAYGLIYEEVLGRA
jgi:glycosyltransferase involved in cell wall biosynthesis